MKQELKSFVRPAVKSARLMLNRALEPYVSAVTRLTPITKHDEQDIFIVGYPKSGNTWVQYLIAGVIYRVDPLYAPDRLVQQLVPDVHYNRYYKRFHDPTFFKSHSFATPNYRRVIYLMRDGRDAMVSYYHYLAAITGKEHDFVNVMHKGAWGKWHEHVERWMSNPYGADMMVLKYEDLKDDTTRELQRICQFVGVTREPELLEKVARNSSFEKMHLKEKKAEHVWENPKWSKEHSFIRRGQVGSFRSEMPPEVLDLFVAEASTTLKKYGYDL